MPESFQHEKRTWLQTINPLSAVTQLTRFARPGDAPASGNAEVPIRKRGRPPKHRKSESGNESGYGFIRALSRSRSPPARSRKSMSPVKRTRSGTRRSRSKSAYGARDRYANGAADVSNSATRWEAAGLVWCLGILGGLGMASVGVFGAEVAHAI